MSSELKEVINSPILLKLVAQHAFQTVDVNKNGFIDFEEFEDMIKDMANQLNITPPNRYEMTKAFQELDKDQDQQISFQEFQLMVKEIIKIMIGDQ